MFEILFIISISLYFIQAILISIGAKKQFKKIDVENLPSATVIVAARNEEKNISECLESLNKLIYPEGKLEIILVDDFSDDQTKSIIEKYITDKPIFKLIQPIKNYGQTLGKARAIANGIEVAKGEIIFTTDADCVVNPNWVKTLASYYTDDVAMVCGYTNQKSDNIFEAVQDIDFIYLLIVAAGSINIWKPISAIGNNMSYRKSAYLEVGGYEKIPFSVTEDFQLLMAIHDHKKYKIIYPLDSEGLVTSKPCLDFKTIFHQKKRWAVGGLNVRLDGAIVIGTAMFVMLLSLLIPFNYSDIALYLLVFKLFTDYFMISNVYKSLKLKLKIINFIAFEIYVPIYFIVTSVNLLFSRKVMWKGRKF
ncbi:MAG: glycosyltransferase [Ignavibacteriae bacterium]|nr:glycosyltransferase [Ignavibacteriota bacterium]